MFSIGCSRSGFGWMALVTYPSLTSTLPSLNLQSVAANTVKPILPHWGQLDAFNVIMWDIFMSSSDCVRKALCDSMWKEGWLVWWSSYNCFGSTGHGLELHHTMEQGSCNHSDHWAFHKFWKETCWNLESIVYCFILPMILSAAILSVGGKDGCGHVELWRGGKACFHDFGQITTNVCVWPNKMADKFISSESPFDWRVARCLSASFLKLYFHVFFFIWYSEAKKC